jgi:hypothetical protein
MFGNKLRWKIPIFLKKEAVILWKYLKVSIYLSLEEYMKLQKNLTICKCLTLQRKNGSQYLKNQILQQDKQEKQVLNSTMLT